MNLNELNTYNIGTFWVGVPFSTLNTLCIEFATNSEWIQHTILQFAMNYKWIHMRWVHPNDFQQLRTTFVYIFPLESAMFSLQLEMPNRKILTWWKTPYFVDDDFGTSEGIFPSFWSGSVASSFSSPKSSFSTLSLFFWIRSGSIALNFSSLEFVFSLFPFVFNFDNSIQPNLASQKINYSFVQSSIASKMYTVPTVQQANWTCATSLVFYLQLVRIQWQYISCHRLCFKNKLIDVNHHWLI